MKEAFSPIEIEVFHHLFQSVAEEMGVVLMRAAFSPNIKERLDHSCAVFDGDGELLAQAAHIPVHLGSMPASVRAAIEAVPPKPGQTVILNDPYSGGTHLPDVTLVTPVFVETSSEPAFFVANRAHHADVGGASPGSLPLSRHIGDEGFRIEPTVLDDDVTSRFCAASRTPAERHGDLAAQKAANRFGARRIEDLVATYGSELLRARGSDLRVYTARLMRNVIAQIPNGVYIAEDVLDGDGFDAHGVPLRVKIHIAGDHCTIDFSDCADQVPGPVNAVRAITVSVVFYVMRTLAPNHLPTNAGCLQPITIVTRRGTIVDAQYPAPVAVGNVETSQRVVDLLLRALAPALPDLVPAASSGTMSNVCIGGNKPSPFVYYETIGGGAGAGPSWDGVSGVHTHMTNTLNTPIEALEHAYPMRVTRYCIRRQSGGDGAHRGGDGIIREYELLEPSTVTVIAERHRFTPYGLNGGGPGEPGRLTLFDSDGSARTLPGKVTLECRPGQRLRVETAGGGGFGERGEE